jgi:cytochrome c peroxidase
VDHDNASVASAALYHPTGALVFVALETSRQVVVMDPVGRRELFRFDTGRAPQALTLSPDGLRLFVHNFMDRTVGVHSLEALLRRGESSAAQVGWMSTVGTEKLSATVLKGKQLFYDARDPRLARDAYMSCASCHNDGGHDGRTWDLTGQGEGLRNTISLRGRAGAQGRLHWSGNFDEVQDFEGQIRSLAQGTGLMTDAQFNTGTRAQPLGDRKSGVSADLDALAAYVSSLTTFDASPWRTSAGQLTTAASAGRSVFAAHCVSCHGGNDFTDSAAGVLRNVGTLKPSSGKRLNATLTGLDTPTLRDVWATAPYLHDGSAATVDDAVRAHTGLTLTASDLSNVSEFVRQIGGTEAAVNPLVPAGTGTGLRGQYSNKGWFGTTTLVLTRTENPSFDWGTGRPASNVNADNFVVKWTGTVQAEEGGVYRFQTLSDDGVRVTVNGQQLINNWTAHGPTTDTSAAITLEAGKRYTIVIDYYEQTGGAVMRLSWQKPGASAFTAIPTNRLYLP